ncbi:MAG TPA: hypothetical protein VGN88_04215 [Phycisphaerae bacterium]|jgi:hypothetical protein
MKPILILMGMSAFLVSCQQEVIAVHDSSIASQFSKLNKNGWQVADNNQPKTARPGTPGDPNVRIVKEADFSQLRFNTNFQVDDARLRGQMESNQDPNQSIILTPFGPPTIAPRTNP